LFFSIISSTTEITDSHSTVFLLFFRKFSAQLSFQILYPASKFLDSSEEHVKITSQSPLNQNDVHSLAHLILHIIAISLTACVIKLDFVLIQYHSHEITPLAMAMAFLSEE
jgi:hypothetical protein